MRHLAIDGVDVGLQFYTTGQLIQLRGRRPEIGKLNSPLDNGAPSTYLSVSNPIHCGGMRNTE